MAEGKALLSDDGSDSKSEWQPHIFEHIFVMVMHLIIDL